jgi:hypothetical protein
LPLSQEQGTTDTEIVAATRFAALNSSLFKPILENQSGQPILLPNNRKKRCFFHLDRYAFTASTQSYDFEKAKLLRRISAHKKAVTLLGSTLIAWPLKTCASDPTLRTFKAVGATCGSHAGSGID